MNPILAIDPGASGGIAWRTSDGTVHVEPMPYGMTAQADLLRTLVVENPGISAVIERTGGYVPGNSGPSAVKFARHCGNLEAIIYTLGIPMTMVAPTVWQKALGALPHEKPERKRTIREMMARAYPHLSVTLKTADALAILHYSSDER